MCSVPTLCTSAEQLILLQTADAQFEEVKWPGLIYTNMERTNSIFLLQEIIALKKRKILEQVSLWACQTLSSVTVLEKSKSCELKQEKQTPLW